MKRLLTILFLFTSFVSIGQQPYLPSTDGTPVNRPLGASNFSTDGRTMFHDRTNFLWRDYRNTAEVLSTLNTANHRKGGALIFIHNGGTLGSNGLYTGGTREIWWFKDGITDGDLVPFAAAGTFDTTAIYAQLGTKITLAQARAGISVTGSGLSYNSTTGVITGSGSGGSVTFAVDSTDTRGATHIGAWGTSLTYGTGGQVTSVFPGGTPYGEYVKNLTGYEVVNYGGPGETSTQIKTRFLAAPQTHRWGTILEMGANNYSDTTTVLADIAACVAALQAVGNDRYLVLNIAGQSSSAFWSGTSQYNLLTALNNRLATIYGAHYVDIRSALVAAYNPGISQDVTDHGHDIPPTSLMYPSDVTHFNSAGYQVWANTIVAKMNVFKPTADEKAISTRSVLEMFRNAPPVNTAKLVALRATLNFPNVKNTVYTDGNSGADVLPLEINGGQAWWNQRATSGAEGGILFRNRYADEGGKATMLISGTNLSVWNNINKGLVIRNDVARFDFGIPISVAGEITDVTAFKGAAATITGAVHSQFFSNQDPVTYTPRRSFDMSRSNLGGFLPPFLDQSSINAITGPDATPGHGFISEMLFNRTTGRMEVAVEPGTGYGYGLFKPLAYLTDIGSLDGSETKVQAGVNTYVTGAGTTGNPYIIHSVPASVKLSGTLFGTAPATSGGGSIAGAFDNNLSTFFSGEYVPNNYLGMTLDTAKVPVKIRLYPRTGVDFLQGAIVQGSNTSSASGFVNLFTIPSGGQAPPYDQFTDYIFANTTAYKYIRLFQNNAQNSLAAVEIEFWGYALPTGTGGGSTDTSSLSRRIDSVLAKVNRSFSGIIGLTDSSGAAWTRPNGTADTVRGSFGGSPGTDSGSTPSASQGIIYDPVLNRYILDTAYLNEHYTDTLTFNSTMETVGKIIGVRPSLLISRDTAFISHLMGRGSSPSMSFSTGAGTSPGGGILFGKDMAFAVSIVAGSSPAAAGSLIGTITFAVPYTTSYPILTWAPVGSASTNPAASAGFYFSPSSTGIQIRANTTLVAGTTYQMNIMTAGY